MGLRYTNVLRLEEGVRKVIGAIEDLSERPILVGVYGWPDSGKSYLINRVGEHFDGEGLETARCGGSPHEETFERIRDNPRFVPPLLLFHCGWEMIKFPNGMIIPDDDPGRLAKKFLDRGLDLSIGIYNPSFSDGITGDYDIVISNSNSARKNFQRNSFQIRSPARIPVVM